MNPPPIPPEARVQPNRSSLFHLAAKISLLFPVIVVALSQLEKAAHTREMTLLIGGVMFGLLLLGLIAAIVGLCGIGKYDARGLLGFGMSGLALNGLLMVIFATNFISGYQKAHANDEKLAALRDAYHSQTLDNYNTNTGVDPDKALKQLNEYQTNINALSQQMTGDDALAMQVTQLFMQRMQAGVAKMVAAQKAVTAAEVLDTSTLTNRNDIEPRRQLLRELMADNEAVRYLITNRTQFAQSELKARGVSANAIKEFLAGMNQSFPEDLSNQLRDCGKQSCEAQLGILDLLDSEWGKWKYNFAKDKLQFNDDATIDKYNELVQTITDLSQKEIDLQGEILKWQQARRARRQ
jgi:hypothetical protein